MEATHKQLVSVCRGLKNYWKSPRHIAKVKKVSKTAPVDADITMNYPGKPEWTGVFVGIKNPHDLEN